MLKNIVLTALVALGVSACSKGKSNGAPAGNSTFQGTWLADDILEYKSSKDPKFICANIENEKWTEHKDEFKIDGFVIDGKGTVFDFRIDESLIVQIWKVNFDGSTYDNQVLENKDSESSEGTANIVGHSMTKIDSDTISSNWQLKNSSGGIDSGNVKYVRMSDAEVSVIRKTFNECIKNRKP